NLGCQNLLNIQDPVALTMDGNGVVIGAVYTLPTGQTVQIGQVNAGNGGNAAPNNQPATSNLQKW
ncbi:MAG TPA: hypothetical protein VH593_17680, partial [Ktedonobacteraceae bacterium]